MSRVRLDDLGGADPYSVLGVDYDADSTTIVAAHRQLIRQVHPDLPGGDEEHAKLLHVARDVLLDPELRRSYDADAGVPPPESEERPRHGSHRRRPPWTVLVATWWLTRVRPHLDRVSPGLLALIAAVVFGPLGLYLGLQALGDPQGRLDRVCATVAVAWGMAFIMCGGGYLLLGIID